MIEIELKNGDSIFIGRNMIVYADRFGDPKHFYPALPFRQWSRSYRAVEFEDGTVLTLPRPEEIEGIYSTPNEDALFWEFSPNCVVAVDDAIYILISPNYAVRVYFNHATLSFEVEGDIELNDLTIGNTLRIRDPIDSAYYMLANVDVFHPIDVKQVKVGINSEGKIFELTLINARGRVVYVKDNHLFVNRKIQGPAEIVGPAAEGTRRAIIYYDGEWTGVNRAIDKNGVLFLDTELGLVETELEAMRRTVKTKPWPVNCSLR